MVSSYFRELSGPLPSPVLMIGEDTQSEITWLELGAKPDWRAASLNQFSWQPSRTVPIHCTDNWKRRKVLEQTPVYRSLAGRGWIKYCIVSNITNCTCCRQQCLWHTLFLTTSTYWLMNRKKNFFGSPAWHASFCQAQWENHSELGGSSIGNQTGIICGLLFFPLILNVKWKTHFWFKSKRQFEFKR